MLSGGRASYVDPGPAGPPHPSPETLWETQPHQVAGQASAGGGYGPVLLTGRKAVRAHYWDFAIGAASSLPCDAPGVSRTHRSLYKPH